MAELEAAFAVTPTLHKGGGGVFDVVVEGEMIFSKHDSGRFPDPGEIVSLLEKRRG